MTRTAAISFAIIAMLLLLVAMAHPAHSHSCATVRHYVSAYGYAVAAKWARANLSASQIRRARACLRGRR